MSTCPKSVFPGGVWSANALGRCVLASGHDGECDHLGPNVSCVLEVFDGGANAQFPHNDYVKVDPDARGGVTYELRPRPRRWMELKTRRERVALDLGWAEHPKWGPVNDPPILLQDMRVREFAQALDLVQVSPTRWLR